MKTTTGCHLQSLLTHSINLLIPLILNKVALVAQNLARLTLLNRECPRIQIFIGTMIPGLHPSAPSECGNGRTSGM